MEAYDRISVEDLEDYEEFKSTIFRVSELRLEAYCLQFRGARRKTHEHLRGLCSLYGRDVEEMIVE